MLSRPRRGSTGSSNIDAAPHCPRAPRGVGDAGSPLPTPLGGPGAQKRFLSTSHHPRSHLHLSGPPSKWSPSSATGPCWVLGVSTAHQPPETAQSRLLAQPRLVLGRGKEQWTRPPSTSQTSLPGAGTKDGGREGRRQRGSWPVHPQHTQSQFCPAHRFHSNAHPHRATPGGCTHPSVQRCTNSSIHTVVHTLPGTTGTPTRYTLTGAHTHRSLLPEEPNPSLHLLSATWCWRGGNPTQNVPPRVNQTGGRS